VGLDFQTQAFWAWIVGYVQGPNLPDPSGPDIHLSLSLSLSYYFLQNFFINTPSLECIF